MILNNSLKLLLNNNPSDGGGGDTTPAVTDAPPLSVKAFTPKSVGVEAQLKELPATSKDFQFKIEDISLLQDKDGSIVPPIEVEKKTNVIPANPLDVAKEAIKNDQLPKAPVKPATQPKEVKAEVPVAPVVAQVTKQEDVVPKGPLVPKSKVAEKEFDYTGFAPDEAAALKQMSTTARDFTIKILKERKELSSQSGGSYLQHPDAYVLDPQFNALSQDINYAQMEAQFYKQQLIKVSNGEKGVELKGWKTDGTPVLGNEILPTKANELELAQLVNDASTILRQKNGELNNFAQTYKQRVSNDSNLIQSERVKRFGWVADPKIMDSTLVVEDGSEQTVKQVRDTLINLFPSYMRKEMGVQVAADLFAAFQIIQQELREKSSTTAVVQQQVKDTARAEPTTTRSASVPVANGRAFGGVTEFKIDPSLLGS